MAPMITGRITITSGNKWIDINVGSGDEAISIAEGVYNDIIAVVAALDAALKAAHGNLYASIDASTHVVCIGYNTDLIIMWSTGSHATSNIGSVLGYDITSDDNGAKYYDGDYAATGLWWPSRSISVDTCRWINELVGGQRQRTISGAAVKQVIVGYRRSRSLEIHELPAWCVWEASATGSYTNRSLEAFLRTYIGDVVTWYDDHESLVDGVACYIDIADDWASAMNRPHVEIDTWNVRLRLLRVE